MPLYVLVCHDEVLWCIGKKCWSVSISQQTSLMILNALLIFLLIWHQQEIETQIWCAKIDDIELIYITLLSIYIDLRKLNEKGISSKDIVCFTIKPRLYSYLCKGCYNLRWDFTYLLHFFCHYVTMFLNHLPFSIFDNDEGSFYFVMPLKYDGQIDINWYMYII